MLSWKWVWLGAGLASLVWVSVGRNEPRVRTPAPARASTSSTTPRPAIKLGGPRPLAPVAFAAVVPPPSTPGYSFDYAGSIPVPWFGPNEQIDDNSFMAVDVGDVTADGRADVVALGYGVASVSYPFADSEVLVYAQRADGALAAPARYKIDIDWLRFLQLGDFNEDGTSDVLILGQSKMQVYLSRRGGGFTTYTKPIWDEVEPTYTIPPVLLDVNGDGHLDLVFHFAATHVNDSPTDPNADQFSRLAYWYGDGHGAFPSRGSQATYPASATIRGFEQALSMATGDINNDGRTDLAVRVMQHNGEIWQHLIRFFVANGSGRLVESQTMEPRMEIGSNYSAMDYIALGDFNGDLRTDIAGSDGNAGVMNDRTWIVHQSATGKFNTAPISRTVEPIGTVLRVADLDRNGADDLLLAHDGWSRASWLLQSGGQLAQAQMKQNGGWDGTVNQTGLAVGDINGDKCPDAVMSYSYYGLQIMLGHGCGKAVRMPRALEATTSRRGMVRMTTR